MAYEFKLPDIGEGLTEGEIVKWLVAKGDSVEEDQPVVEVMTDKATVQIPSPASGTIRDLKANEGDVVPVGDVIFVIDEGVGGGEAKEEEKEEEEKGEKKEEKKEPAEKEEKKAEKGDEKEKEDGKEKTREAAKAGDSNGGEAPATLAREGKVLAAPATRKLARELDIDLTKVEGSGPRGRVTKEDVKTASEGGAKRPSAAPGREAPKELEERVPLRGLRRKIAEKMVQSKFTAPHFTYVEQCDFTKLVEFRRSVKGLAEERGIKLTYLAFIVKALVPTLREFPSLNASLDEDSQEIVLKHYYNIGIATATEQGLMVPVVKGVDARSIFEIAGEIERVTGDARTGKAKSEDQRGGTFTITSTGNLGGVMASPIINYPEVAILGVHKIRPTPVVRDGEIVIGQMGNLSISLDHRVVDGAVAAEFLNRLIQYLEEPNLLMVEGM